MIIAISGASGFIGRHLSTYFSSKGNEVRNIPRIESGLAEFIKTIEGTDVVINLAGAPVIGRWSRSYKDKLVSSRVKTTLQIVEAINAAEKKPELLISASAIGIYSAQGEHTESKCVEADDFLGKLCREWETAAKGKPEDTRLAIVRMGIVLGKDGGAFQRMFPLFRKGLGGKIASGKQGFSWIHIYDVVQAIDYIISNRQVQGVFNFTAPQVVDNHKFTLVLARAVGRRAFMAVPAFMLRLLFGEGSVAVAGGQFVHPENLQKAGFMFNYPKLSDAVDDLINN